MTITWTRRWLLAVICGAVCCAGPTLAADAAKGLDIYWIDVEGGAATLMVFPSGESLLVDTGNPGRRDAQRIFDVAAKVAGLRQIDHLVITHFHGDHFGGAATLSTLLPIENVYDNGEFPGGRERPDKAYLEFKASRRSVVNPGEEFKLKPLGAGSPKLSLRCLGTRQQFVAASGTEKANEVCADARQKDRDVSDNANSIVLLLSYGPFRFYDAGDLTWNMEQQLVCPANLVGQVDVYQSTHHGLDVSNNPVLVRSVSPRVAIINNGTTKGCQPDTFQTLKSCPSVEAIYQVHKNLRPDTQNNAPDEYIANLEAMCQANYIKLAVAADGASYTVSIPANGHSRTYKTRGM